MIGSLKVPATVSAWDLLAKLGAKKKAFAGADVLVNLEAEVACTTYRGAGDLITGGCYAALPRAHPLAVAGLWAAHKALSAKLEADCKDWRAWAARAWCLLLLGRPHCATVDGIECQDCDPFQPDGCGIVAEACLEMGSPAEARVHILNALAASVNDDRLHHCLQAIEAAAPLIEDIVLEDGTLRLPEMKYPLLNAPARRATEQQKAGGVSALLTDDGSGYCLTATKPFSAGEILWIETPLVSVCLDPMRCQRCLLPVRVASGDGKEEASALSVRVPAVRADCGELFCSERCKNTAFDEWHKVHKIELT